MHLFWNSCALRFSVLPTLPVTALRRVLSICKRFSASIFITKASFWNSFLLLTRKKTPVWLIRLRRYLYPCVSFYFDYFRSMMLKKNIHSWICFSLGPCVVCAKQWSAYVSLHDLYTNKSDTFDLGSCSGTSVLSASSRKSCCFVM